MSPFDDADNPHTWRGEAWQVVFWKDGTACGHKEANKATLETWTKGCGWSRFQDFELSDDGRYALENVLRVFTRIFNAGIESGKGEVRKALGL